MYVWSKALAIALAVTLLGFGVMAVQAKDNHHKNNSCAPPPQACPAPQLPPQEPIAPTCCAMPQVQHRCGPPVQTGCCPVDPKKVAKAEKEALHAQHEAAEACERQQKAIAKAQHELEEARERQQAKIDKANAKLNNRAAELQEANAKYESFYGGPSEAVAETPVVPQPTAQPEPEVIRSKPEPGPISEVQPQQPQIIEEQVAVLQVPPAPSPEPATSEKPKELPKTASPFSLVGLVGLASMSAYATTLFRR